MKTNLAKNNLFFTTERWFTDSSQNCDVTTREKEEAVNCINVKGTEYKRGKSSSTVESQ